MRKAKLLSGEPPVPVLEQGDILSMPWGTPSLMEEQLQESPHSVGGDSCHSKENPQYLWSG